MNRLISVVAIASVLAGCKQQPSQQQQDRLIKERLTHAITGNSIALPDSTAAAAPEQHLTDAQKISLLRVEAHKRHLRWYVHCYPSDDGKDLVLAVAWPRENDRPNNIIEKGGKGMWIDVEHIMQADAAYALYQSIQQPMTHPPEHAEPLHPHKQCPPELRGE